MHLSLLETNPSSLETLKKGKWLLCPSKAGCIDFEETGIYLNFDEVPPLSEVLWEKYTLPIVPFP